MVSDAGHHGVAILPPAIRASAARCVRKNGRIRLGLNYINRLGEVAIERIVAVRLFVSLADLCRRTRVPRMLIEQLIAAGALDGWGIARRKLL